jgi:hypothetical protein
MILNWFFVGNTRIYAHGKEKMLRKLLTLFLLLYKISNNYSSVFLTKYFNTLEVKKISHLLFFQGDNITISVFSTSLSHEISVNTRHECSLWYATDSERCVTVRYRRRVVITDSFTTNSKKLSIDFYFFLHLFLNVWMRNVYAWLGPGRGQNGQPPTNHRHACLHPHLCILSYEPAQHSGNCKFSLLKH